MAGETVLFETHGIIRCDSGKGVELKWNCANWNIFWRSKVDPVVKTKNHWIFNSPDKEFRLFNVNLLGLSPEYTSQGVR